MTKEIRAAKKIVEYAGFDVKRALNFIEDGTVTFNIGRNKKRVRMVTHRKYKCYY